MRYIALLLILAGCASKQFLWEKPGASGQEFEMDRGQCQAQAFSTPGMYTMQIALVYNSCMRGRGWYQVEQ